VPKSEVWEVLYGGNRKNEISDPDFLFDPRVYVHYGVYLDTFWHFTFKGRSIAREPLNVGRLVLRLDD